MSTQFDDKGWKLQFGSFKGSIPTLALVMMIAGILLPAVFYSSQLRNPTPARLLIAICVALFASVIYLWILDATGILVFRKEWISKSIYGAAIASVLGTSVAVYKDYFDDDKYPLRGKWGVSIIDKNKNLLSENELLMGYSRHSSVYYGFSNFVSHSYDTGLISYLEIKQLSPEDKFIIYQLGHPNGRVEAFKNSFTLSGNSAQIQIKADSASANYEILISRPNY